jgi:3-hydroxyisobutyrate dehydrogenase-like beta-hydroxyacid dehydrogenase
VVVDLTTQSLVDVRRTSGVAAEAGLRYVAGGITGGVAGIERSAGAAFVGGADVRAFEVDALAGVGAVIALPSVDHAVAAKLLHNWYLFATGAALAQAAAVAEHLGLAPGALIHAIHTGPAGRAVPSHSVVRDWLGTPLSSYSSRLAAKDLPSIAELFAEADVDSTLPLPDLLEAAFADAPDQPFSSALLACCSRGQGKR